MISDSPIRCCRKKSTHQRRWEILATTICSSNNKQLWLHWNRMWDRAQSRFHCFPLRYWMVIWIGIHIGREEVARPLSLSKVNTLRDGHISLGWFLRNSVLVMLSFWFFPIALLSRLAYSICRVAYIFFGQILFNWICAIKSKTNYWNKNYRLPIYVITSQTNKLNISPP